MRPQYSLNHFLREIWAYDPWSRKEVLKICEDLKIQYTEVPTTMGTPAFKFEKDDFELLVSRLGKM